MHYIKKGSGYPLLLLHGYCETGRVWNSILNDLTSKVQVIVPDLPGFGLSDSIGKSFSIEDVAVKVNHLMGSLGFEKYIVMGHSLGGYVSLALENSFPQNIKAFGLIHSTAFADSIQKKEGRDQVVKIVSNKGTGLFLQNFYQNLFHQPVDNVIQELQEEGKNIKGESIMAYAKAMRDRPDRIGLMQSDKPKLFVAGVEDGAVPISDSRKIRDLSKNCTYRELQNTGHMGMYEERDLLVTEMLNFLRPLI